MDIPFPAYHGTEPYLFVSYAHEDAADVYPEMKRLHELGYQRIWYDQGIRPSEPWIKEIAEAVAGCSQMLVFMTPNAAKSEWVFHEMSFAKERRKVILTVHLIATELPDEVGFILNPYQHIFKYKEQPQSYISRIEEGILSNLRIQRPPGMAAECDSADRTVQMSTEWKDWEQWVNAFPEYHHLNRASFPFEPIAGRLGRLVYQVIGKDGPVFNPKNICYLSPGDQGYPSNLPALKMSEGINLSNLVSVFSGLNLIASVADLFFSAKILHRIGRLEEQIDAPKREILARLDSTEKEILAHIDASKREILVSLHVINAETTQIDIKVREMHLRESLKFLSRSFIRGNTIDLVEIKKFQGDVDDFIEHLEPFEYGNLAHRFRFAHDMQERLMALHAFLFNTRYQVAKAHNIGVHGDPSSIISVDNVRDYRPEDPKYVPDFIEEEWSQVEETTGSHLLSCFDAIDRFIKNGKFDESGHWFDESTQEFGESWEWATLNCWLTYVEPTWLWNTDMGLIWRVWKELRGLGDYQKEFPGWSKAAESPTLTNQLMLDCSSGQFIGLDAPRDLSAT